MHFAAPFVAALAAFSAAAEARYSCDRKNYAEVAHQILNPAFFCKWYLSERRNASPLKQFNAKKLTNLCHCFVQNSPRVQGPFKPLHPKPVAKTCVSNYYRSLKNQYSDPMSFCKFFMRFGNRPTSPMPTIQSAQALSKACSCYIAGDFPEQKPVNNSPPPQSSSTAQTTPVETTPAATTPETTPASSTATDAPVQVTTTTTDSIKPTTTTTESVKATTTTTTLALLPTTTTTTSAEPTTTTTTSITAAPTTTTSTSDSSSASATTSTASA